MMRVSSYGMYGFALLTFKTAREGMQFAQRFHRLAAPTFTLSLQERGDEASWVFGDLLGLDSAGPLHRFLIEFQLALQTSLAQDIWQDRVRASLITLRHAQPAHHRLYEQALGCPVLFGQRQDSARFPARLLDTELALYNPLTAAMVHRVCEQLLEQASAPSGMARRVYQILAERPGQFPAMDQVAQALHTTPRTLRRRLEDEGTTFQNLLNDVRANLAKEYLATTRLTSDDIAVALGFSDAGNFRMAFRKWTRRTPSEYRRAAQAAA
jgi:AraC-like DNA-binding protein